MFAECDWETESVFLMRGRPAPVPSHLSRLPTDDDPGVMNTISASSPVLPPQPRLPGQSNTLNLHRHALGQLFDRHCGTRRLMHEVRPVDFIHGREVLHAGEVDVDLVDDLALAKGARGARFEWGPASKGAAAAAAAYLDDFGQRAAAALEDELDVLAACSGHCVGLVSAMRLGVYDDCMWEFAWRGGGTHCRQCFPRQSHPTGWREVALWCGSVQRHRGMAAAQGALSSPDT